MTRSNTRARRQKQLLHAVYTAAVLSCGIVMLPAQAAPDATWDGPGSNLNDGANWQPAGVPSNTATFGSEGNDQLNPTLTGNATINQILFVAGAGGYTISTGANRLSVDGAGVTNSSGLTQTFNVNAAAGVLRFRNSAQISATASSPIEIYNQSGGKIRFEGTTNAAVNGGVNAGSVTLYNRNGGTTRFFDSASAGFAVIENRSAGGTPSGTAFTDTSTAANSQITNQGDGAQTVFFGSAGADSATILNRNDGATSFNGNSHADNAVITNRNGGSTTFNNTSQANAANITNLDGGSLFFNNNTTADNATVDNRNGGTVDISGIGVAGVGIGNLGGRGDVFLGARTLRTGMLDQDNTISGVISDGGTSGGVGGGLTKEGSGTLRLNNDNTYTGATTVTEGTLQIDGSITSDTTINNNGLGVIGRLTGGGNIIGNLTNNGGRIAPGRGIDALGNTNLYTDLSVTGNLAFGGADARLDTRVNGNGAVNRLVVDGAVNITGGQVTVNAEDSSSGGKYLASNRYRILTTGNVPGSSGAFDLGVDSNGIDESQSNIPTYLDGFLTYEPDAVILVLQRNSIDDLNNGSLSGNQQSLFNAFNQGLAAGPLSPDNEDLLNNFILGGNGFLNLASGDALTAYPVLSLRAADRFNQRLLLHSLLQQAGSDDEYSAARAPRLVYTGTHFAALLAQSQENPARSASNTVAARRSSIWATIARAKDDGDSDNNGPGFDARATEYQVGYNRRLSNRTVLGLSIGKSDGKVDINNRLADGDLDTTSFGISLRHDSNNWYASGLLSYSKHDIDSDRFTGIGTASADYDARTVAFSGEVGKTIQRRKYSIEPNISLKLSNTRQDGFTESGPGALSVDSDNYNSRRLGVGVRIISNDATARFRPYGFIGYEREFGDTNATLSNQLAGLPAFRVDGSDLGKNIFSIRLGVDARINDRFSLVGEVGGSRRSNQDSKYIYGGVKYGW